MIFIDELYYECDISKSIVNLKGEFQEILVLKTEHRFEDINLIKTSDKIYSIGDILKVFSDENIYWLEIIDESLNLDNKEIEELKEENKELKKDLETSQYALVDLHLRSVDVMNEVEESNSMNQYALVDLHLRLVDEIDKLTNKISELERKMDG